MSTSELPRSGDTQSEMLVCRTCGLTYSLGETVCSRCGSSLTEEHETFNVDFEPIAEEQLRRQQGNAFLPEQNALSLIVDGQPITVPKSESIIIGRTSTGDDIAQPDIDLTPFKAAQRGVSRYHANIKRKGNMLYIADLRSRNGTWLNGKRLVGSEERLLRDGDAVRLGKLVAVIRFR